MNERRAISLRITGRVQGVFFRNSARSKASSMGIAGLARNEPDGTVYIEAEGSPAEIREFMDWCRKGPSGAKVSEVQVREIAPSGRSGFIIER